MSPIAVASKLCSVAHQFSDMFINRCYAEGVPIDKAIWELVSIFKFKTLVTGFLRTFNASVNYDSEKGI